MNKWILNREQEPPKWEQPMDKISQNVDMPRHSQSTQRHRQRYQMSTNVNFSVRSDRVGAHRARCKAHGGDHRQDSAALWFALCGEKLSIAGAFSVAGPGD